MMKKLISFLFSWLFACLSLHAQESIEKALADIERNNTTLTSWRQLYEAQKLNNRTGMYLQNPEVEFHYLWGNSNVDGNRIDLNVSQSIDFPTAYAFKGQIADAKNVQVEMEYQKQRKSLLLDARQICIDIIYYNILIAELDKRLSHAQRLADSYQAKFDHGEAGILELNKARLNLLGMRKQLERADIERNGLLSELSRLNGGIPMEITDTAFDLPEIPLDFDQWYSQAEEKNPDLVWLKQEIEINRKREKLNLALSLPRLSAGYMSEKIASEQIQGLTVGISVPLWENKNTVKQARIQTLAIQSMETDNKLKYYNQLKTQFEKAKNLQQSVLDYRLSLSNIDNSGLLKKAFDAGEISLIEYILELTIYYSNVDDLIRTERELNKAVALLNQYID